MAFTDVSSWGIHHLDNSIMNNVTFNLLSEHACFDGVQRFYEHDSREIGLPMRFSVYLPPQAAHGDVPVLLYLAGLTCNEETFMTKAGAQRLAAERGLALIAPDTSPRGAQVPGEADSWDFGVGAGFYLDASRSSSNRSQPLRPFVRPANAPGAARPSPGTWAATKPAGWRTTPRR